MEYGSGSQAAKRLASDWRNSVRHCSARRRRASPCICSCKRSRSALIACRDVAHWVMALIPAPITTPSKPTIAVKDSGLTLCSPPFATCRASAVGCSLARTAKYPLHLVRQPLSPRSPSGAQGALHEPAHGRLSRDRTFYYGARTPCCKRSPICSSTASSRRLTASSSSTVADQ